MIGDPVYIRYKPSPITLCEGCHSVRHSKWKKTLHNNQIKKNDLIKILRERPQKFSELEKLYNPSHLRVLIRKLIKDGYNIQEETVESSYAVLDTIIYLNEFEENDDFCDNLNDILKNMVAKDYAYDALMDGLLMTSLHVPFEFLWQNCPEVNFHSMYEVLYRNIEFTIRIYSDVDDAYKEDLTENNLMQFFINDNQILIRLFGKGIPNHDFSDYMNIFPTQEKKELRIFIELVNLVFESVV